MNQLPGKLPGNRFSRSIRRNVSVVLVRTTQSGNIGSAARAMMNMGVRRLKLVSPQQVATEECEKMAGRALVVVEKAGLFDSLEAALLDEHIVIGTTSLRERRHRQPVYTPRRIAGLVRQHVESRRIAVVFGPERSGLSDDELARCQYLAAVPSASEHPVLNLSQAVMLLCYEIAVADESEWDSAIPGEPVTQEDREAMFRQMQEVLVEIGFLSRSNPGHIMRSIRRILAGGQLSARDLQIFRGIFSQMEWFVKAGRKLDPAQVKKP